MKYVIRLGCILLAVSVLSVCSCVNEPRDERKKLNYALNSSGNNKSLLEDVLCYYDAGSEKYKAAEFLISNMPGHCSYLGNTINEYYNIAINIFSSSLSPVEQRDSLLALSKGRFSGVDRKIVQDLKVVRSDFLIDNIEHSYNSWKNGRWATTLTFEQFCEWILPYKCTEMQQLDDWRIVLPELYSDDLKLFPYNDENYYSSYKAVEIVRNEIIRKVVPKGLYNECGLPMLSAQTISKMTYGRCTDYVNLAVLTFRGLGIPAVIDETPIWGRYRAGHSWYVILDERGQELPAEWDVSSQPGKSFFPYQRIPKVYRNTFAANPDRVEYQKTSLLKYPFSLFQIDVTNHYMNSIDVVIPVDKPERIEEKYVYIACFCGHGTDWKIVDYGKFDGRTASFSNMGRDILYMVLGYDGKSLLPVSLPFVVKKDGSVEQIRILPKTERLVARRKYHLTEDVAVMRQRLIGGKIQASNSPDFRNYTEVLVVDSLPEHDLLPIQVAESFRFWRYMAPENSYGSIAELAFFLADSIKVDGLILTSKNASDEMGKKAFDDDWLTCFETDDPNGNWVGLDMGKPVQLKYVRVIPKGDDNDIHPGDEYELSFWDGHVWVRKGLEVAYDNQLTFDDVPVGALLWLRNRTRGWDERPFVLKKSGELQWF
ncbi:MAG: hypothetical protein MJY79_00890 [Bacteroidaceae bacterium]|nr:hypothetical protein [Bacteroidaceae bacterium]